MTHEIIYSYSREQALADGVLIDASKMGQEAGIKYPVALTEALWREYIVPSEDLENQGQSTEGRLWDLLNMFVNCARGCKSNWFIYYCLFLMNPNKQPGLLPIKALIGPGDQGEPVITLMRPEED